MPRPRNFIPTYRKHARTGRAVVSIYRADGSRTEVLLPGEHGSEESKQEYERLMTQLRANNGKLSDRTPSPDLTCAELSQRFMQEHVEPHYRHQDGTATAERRDYIYTLRPFVRLFANKPAREFTPLDLRTYRDSIVAASWMTAEEKMASLKNRGRDGTVGRRVANQRVGRIKRLYKWATEMMLIPPIVWNGLAAVAGLSAGRGQAREATLIEPVPLEIVEAVLPHCSQIIGDIIRVQLFSGARAGEILGMRTCDIDQDTTPGVWTFIPESHKNAWRGHKRHIVFGPRCQLVLRKYLTPDAPGRYTFEPTPARGKSTHHPRYDTQTFDKAIYAACKRASVQRFSSHQLRHLAAQLAERETSIEGARAYLGHKTIALTTHYSGIDLKAAAEVAKRIG